MSETTQPYKGELRIEARRALVLGDAFAPLAAAADAALIVVLSVGAGVLYHLFSYGEVGIIANYVRVGLLAGFFYVAPRSIQKRYEIGQIFSGPGAVRKIFNVWNFAIFCVLFVGFVAKLSDDYSRGAFVLFYLSGLVSLPLLRTATVRIVRRGFRRGWLASRQLMLIGTRDRIDAFRQQIGSSEFGLRVHGIETLPGRSRGDDDKSYAARLSGALERAIDRARSLPVDNIVLLLPWSDMQAISAAREAFLKVPAATVLGPEHILGQAIERGTTRLGPTTGINLVRAPLGLLETFAKRSMDLLLGSIALVFLAPLFAILAVLIKIDSPGPVFFRQYRHGFNQKPFRILKFRTMSVMEDGDTVQQATRDDPRITALGRFMRRWNIDELPQVINVLKGEMSIVGPRPHALIHNEEFQNRIAMYARRHNVKPGITGWAQINGYRGITDTEEKMRGRVEHDLYYIDNWSIWFDLQIIFMTVFSSRAFQNAY